MVDHEERRRAIAQASWRVISRDGVRAASVRTVAAEAGLSTGALRHYFDDHPSLLLFAARHSLELVADRVFGHLAEPDARPRATVQACLEELLPLDGQRAAEGAVYFGLIDQVRFLPEHTAFREQMFVEGRRLYRLLVGWLAGGPQPTPEMLAGDPAAGSTPMDDPPLELRACSLQLFLDGLAVNGLICPGQLDAAALRATLAAELDRLVTEVTPAGAASGSRDERPG